MWTEEKPSFEGKYYTVKDAFCEPKPIQKPHPPIWIGGKGEKLTLKVVAEFADGWNFCDSIDDYERKVNLLSKYCSEVGRKASDIQRSWHGGFLLAQNERKLKRENSETHAQIYSD